MEKISMILMRFPSSRVILCCTITNNNNNSNCNRIKKAMELYVDPVQFGYCCVNNNAFN